MAPRSPRQHALPGKDAAAAIHRLGQTDPMALNITGDERADQVLSDDPFALLVGMLLDQSSS